ncbi:lamin-B1.S-like isoform X2 [Oculina patagonica]
MTTLPPTSPTKGALRYFLEKKEEELKRLNERLASFLDKLRALEGSNSELIEEKKILVESNTKLTSEITISKRRAETELENLRSFFESKLAEVNRLLEEATRQKERLQIDNRKNAALADEFKKKLDKEIAAHKKTQDALKAAQRKLSDKEGQLAAVNQEVRNLEAVVQELRKECQELKEALELANYGLEQERLLRVDLESRLQIRDAELVSMKKKHEEEIVEFRSLLRIEESKRIEIMSQMKVQYEENLAKKLEELRKEDEKRHNSKYAELQEMYAKIAEELSAVREKKRTLTMTVENLKSERNQWKSKYEELQQMCANDWEELSNVREENRTLSISVENLKAQIGQWQSKHASLELRIEDLEKLRAGDQKRAEETIANRDAQIKELQKRIQSDFKYDESLMGVKSALDSDIIAYRKMIEEEEARWNITSPSKRKRRRIEVPDYEGCIQIEEASADGKFVQLYNNGSKDFPLGGWSVERSVDGKPPVIYKFTSKYVLKSGSYVTIWASKAGGQHKPPTDLVFRQKASWGVGKETKTVLRDSDGQEAASEVHEEVTIIRSDETDVQEAITAISEEVRVIRTDQTDNREIIPGLRQVEGRKSCIIQ